MNSLQKWEVVENELIERAQNVTNHKPAISIIKDYKLVIRSERSIECCILKRILFNVERSFTFPSTKVVWPLNYAYYLTDQTMHIIWQQFLSTYVINFLKENKQVFGPFYGNSKTSNLMDRRVDFLWLWSRYWFWVSALSWLNILQIGCEMFNFNVKIFLFGWTDQFYS